MNKKMTKCTTEFKTKIALEILQSKKTLNEIVIELGIFLDRYLYAKFATN